MHEQTSKPLRTRCTVWSFVCVSVHICFVCLHLKIVTFYRDVNYVNLECVCLYKGSGKAHATTFPVCFEGTTLKLWWIRLFFLLPAVKVKMIFSMKSTHAPLQFWEFRVCMCLYGLSTHILSSILLADGSCLFAYRSNSRGWNFGSGLTIFSGWPSMSDTK